MRAWTLHCERTNVSNLSVVGLLHSVWSFVSVAGMLGQVNVRRPEGFSLTNRRENARDRRSEETYTNELRGWLGDFFQTLLEFALASALAPSL